MSCVWSSRLSRKGVHFLFADVKQNNWCMYLLMMKCPLFNFFKNVAHFHLVQKLFEWSEYAPVYCVLQALFRIFKCLKVVCVCGLSYNEKHKTCFHSSTCIGRTFDFKRLKSAFERWVDFALCLVSAFAGRLWGKCFMYISADKTQYSVKSTSIQVCFDLKWISCLIFQ